MATRQWHSPSKPHIGPASWEGDLWPGPRGRPMNPAGTPAGNLSWQRLAAPGIGHRLAPLACRCAVCSSLARTPSRIHESATAI
eukprot:1477950-Pyramimonas_sp.AAC.1